MKKIATIILMTINAIAVSAIDAQYHFPTAIPQSAKGIYVSQSELASIEKFHSICWVGDKTRKSFFRVYGISSGDAITIRGIEGDGFAVDSIKFKKWNLNNLENGKIIDDNGEVFFKISNVNPTGNADLMKPARSAAWRRIVANLASDPNNNLYITDQGLLYNGIIYTLREPMYWMKGQRSWLGIDVILIGDKNPSWLSTEYANGVLRVIKMKEDPNSDTLMDDLEIGKLVLKK